MSATRLSRPPLARPAATGRSRDQARSSPTLHVLGPGAVGRALLRRLAGSPYRLVAVSDSTATLHDRQGLDPQETASFKAIGGRFADRRTGRRLTTRAALARVSADVVVDLTPTSERPGWADALEAGVLARGARLVLAAKDALARRTSQWLRQHHAGRVGCNAVLGGTGAQFVRELPELESRVRAVAIAGNASTTAILDVIERGGSFEDGLADARARGLLEADPELDLRGADAAVKLAIVVGALRGRTVSPDEIECDDIRTLDPELVRERARQGRTTRLIARLTPDRRLRVSFEEVPVHSPLAVACDRVAYLYEVDDGTTRVHAGGGLGPDATAAAVLADLENFAAPRVSDAGDAT